MNLTSLAILVVMFLIALFTGSKACGQAPTNPTVDEQAAKKVDEFLAQWHKKDMPGGAVGVIKDGKLIYTRGLGMANLDYDIPNTPSTRFNLASVSKPFTAFSIAILAQQGKLSLDDDIRKHVPEMPKYDDTVTIRHLIHHTSGIREYEALVRFGGLDTDKAYSPKAILNMLARQKNLSFAPGAKYSYSNSGYFLMGIIVERVSGKSLRAFAEENIFKPLGMKDTQFYDNRFEVIKNRAHGYQVGPDKSIRARSSLYDLVGAGGILTTIEDLYLWTQNYYEPKVGNKELIKLVTTPGTFNSGEKMTYAFGLWRGEYKGLPTITHSGNMAGYRARIGSFPEQKFTVIALSNNSAILPSEIVAKLADIYLDGQFKPVTPTPKSVTASLPPSVSLAGKEALRFAGIYANPENGQFFKLGIKDGRLINAEFFKKEVPVTAVSENRLLVIEGNGSTELLPVFDKSGAVSEIRITAKNGKPDIYVPMKPQADSPEKLSEFVGTYHSDEFDTDYKISMKGNSLVFYISENLEPPLTAAYADLFTSAGGQINLSFMRDSNGKITGFVFNSAIDDRDVKGVVFTRR